MNAGEINSDATLLFDSEYEVTSRCVCETGYVSENLSLRFVAIIACL
jgi:hypothetical protein